MTSLGSALDLYAPLPEGQGIPLSERDRSFERFFGPPLPTFRPGEDDFADLCEDDFGEDSSEEDTPMGEFSHADELAVVVGGTGIGNDKVYILPNLIVHGDRCVVKGDCCAVRGDNNKVYGNYCTVKGNGCEIFGDSCTITGNHNRVLGKHAIVRGDSNQVFNPPVSINGSFNNVLERVPLTTEAVGGVAAGRSNRRRRRRREESASGDDNERATSRRRIHNEADSSANADVGLVVANNDGIGPAAASSGDIGPIAETTSEPAAEESAPSAPRGRRSRAAERAAAARLRLEALNSENLDAMVVATMREAGVEPRVAGSQPLSYTHPVRAHGLTPSHTRRLRRRELANRRHHLSMVMRELEERGVVEMRPSWCANQRVQEPVIKDVGIRAVAALKNAKAVDGESKCTICIDNKCNVVLVPCGHVCVCAECVLSLHAHAIGNNDLSEFKCPMCRKECTFVTPFHVV